jgi:hypothetical protein
MAWTDKDKRLLITELQVTQRQINFLQKSNNANPDPSIENSIELLRNSQDNLYNALAYHGVTAEEVYRVIMENSDKFLIAEILNLQKIKTNLDKKLADPALSPKKRQILEVSLAQTSQQYKELWDEMTNSPNRADLMNRVETAMTKDMQKARAQDKNREPDRTR